MATWNTYRVWHQQMIAVANAGCSQSWFGEWKPTDILFRARSQQEAQKKADKFWREGELGSGSMLCIPADEDLSRPAVSSRFLSKNHA